MAIGLLLCGIATQGCEFQPHVFVSAPPKAESAIDVHKNGFSARWFHVFGAENYSLEYSTDSLFASGNFITFSTKDTILPIEELDVFTRYFYRVASTIDGENYSKYSNTISVVTTNLNPPLLKTPMQVNSFFTRRVDWDHVEGATSYIIEVAEDPDFNTRVSGLADLGTLQNSIEFNVPDFRKRYYVRGASTVEERKSDWSETLILDPVRASNCVLRKVENGIFSYTFYNNRDTRLLDSMKFDVIEESIIDGVPVKIIATFQKTKFEYDSEGFLHTATANDVNIGRISWDFEHNADGTVSSLKVLSDSLGGLRDATFKYSSAGQLQAVDLYSDYEGASESYTFEYDDAGNVVRQIASWGGKLSFTYDQVLSPIYFLPHEVQMMVLLAPEVEFYYSGYTANKFFPLFPKVLAVASVSVADGETRTYNNNSIRGVLQVRESEENRVAYSIGGCQ